MVVDLLKVNVLVGEMVNKSTAVALKSNKWLSHFIQVIYNNSGVIIPIYVQQLIMARAVVHYSPQNS